MSRSQWLGRFACAVALALSIIVLESSEIAVASVVVQGESQRSTNPLSFVQDTNTCGPFTTNNSSAVQSSDVLKTVSGTVTSSAGAVPNAIVTSVMDSGSDFKVNCAVTASDGTYSLQVLKLESSGDNSSVGEIVVSPPITSAQSALLTNQLGSGYVRVSGSSNETKNFTLTPANGFFHRNGFIPENDTSRIDYLTGPFSLNAIEFDPTPSTPASGYVRATAAVARGSRISGSITTIRGLTRPSVSGDSMSGQKVLRLTFAGGNPGFYINPGATQALADPILVSGIPNVVGTSVDESTFNGRWFNPVVVSDGSGGSPFEVDLASSRVQTFGATGVSAVSATADVWRAFYSLPPTVQLGATTYDLTGKDSDGSTQSATDLRRVLRIRASDGQTVATHRRDTDVVCAFAFPDCTEFGMLTIEYDQTVAPWGLPRNVITLAQAITGPLCSGAATGVLSALFVSNRTTRAPASCGTVSLGQFDPEVISKWEEWQRTLTHYSRSGNTATYTTSGSHPWRVGDDVNIFGISDNSFNVTRAIITAVPTSNSFSVTTSSSSSTAQTTITTFASASSSRFGVVDSSGRAGISLPNGAQKIYRLRYFPLPGGASAATEVIIRASVTDGVLDSVQECVSFNLGAGTCNSAWTAPTLHEGRSIFLVESTNFVGIVRTPVSASPSSAPASSASVSIAPLSSSDGVLGFRSWVGAMTGLDGVFRTKLTAGSYKFEVRSPSNASYPTAEQYVRISGELDAITVERCTGFNSAASSVDTAFTGCTSSSATTASPLLVQFQSSDLTGVIFLDDGITPASFAGTQLEKLGSECAECWSSVSHQSTGQTGSYSLAFSSAGTYRLIVNLPWNYTGTAVRSIFTITVTISGATRTVTVNGDSDGQVNLTMSGANFSSRVLTSNSPVAASAYASAGFELYDDSRGQYVWQSVWGNGNALGEFGVSLSAGKWRVTVRPGSADAGTHSSAYYYAFVVAGGSPSVYVNSRESCAVIAPISSCSSTVVSSTGGRYQLLLKSANVSGYAARTSAVTRAPNGAPVSNTDAVSWGWVEVQRYNADFRQYQWTGEVQGSSTDANGRFGLNLPEGKYRLSINPRPTDSAAGLTRKNFDITVASGGTVTCDATYSFCASGASPVSGRFDLHFGSANLSGTVSAGGSAVSSADVRAERWNGSYFEWVNLWANTSSTGLYAMNLETVGAYRVTAQIPGHRTNNGFSPASIFVYRSSSAVCLITEAEVDEVRSCPSSSGAELSGASIALAGSNVRGILKTASNVVVQYGHVNVFRFAPAFNGWQWVQGVPVAADGTFNASLRSTLGETKATAQRFRLEIMPPHGNTTLVRKNVELWVGDLLDNNPTTHSYIVCSATRITNCNFGTNNANVQTSTDTLNVTMFGGNLTGSVQGPSNETVAHPWINLEKWTKPEWSTGNHWVWTNSGSSGSSTGSYVLDTSSDCVSPEESCFFRVNANPGWSNPNNWSKHARIIEVRTSDGSWRVATQTGSASPVGTGSFVSSALNFTLIGSNVTGTVKFGETPVSGSWIALLKQESNDFYQWLGGANSNASGQFGIATASHGAGRYRLEVHPPWNSSYTRFLKDIVVASDGTFTTCATTTTTTADCTGSSSNFTLTFPTANLQIRVCDKDDSGTTCTPVTNSWVGIFNTTTSRWVLGSSTQTNGSVRFNLEDGTYRVDANPAWGNPDGTRVEFEITISGGVLTSPTSATSPVIEVDQTASPRRLDVRLGSPNVSGVVKYDHDGVAETATQNMAHAWVGVYNAATGAWLPGASTGTTGNFELSLPAGNYVVVAHANPAVAQKQPVEARITVAANGSVTLTSGGAWSGVLDFDAVTPNVTFNLIDVGFTARQIFVTKLGSGGTYENYLITAVAPTAGDAEHRLALPAGTYKFRIQKSSGDFDSRGEACRESAAVEVTSGGPTSAGSAALNAWRQGFDATGDDIECKS